MINVILLKSYLLFSSNNRNAINYSNLTDTKLHVHGVYALIISYGKWHCTRREWYAYGTPFTDFSWTLKIQIIFLLDHLPGFKNSLRTFGQLLLFVLREAIDKVEPLTESLVLEVRGRLLHGLEGCQVQLKRNVKEILLLNYILSEV